MKELDPAQQRAVHRILAGESLDSAVAEIDPEAADGGGNSNNTMIFSKPALTKAAIYGLQTEIVGWKRLLRRAKEVLWNAMLPSEDMKTQLRAASEVITAMNRPGESLALADAADAEDKAATITELSDSILGTDDDNLPQA